MSFRQTKEHRSGKNSHHQIGLVRGQFGDVPEDQWLNFLQRTGFDGWEEASWELDLARCATDQGASEYASERIAKARPRQLEIFTVAVHLQGQALGDEPSAKTLQFMGGEAVEAYKDWRKSGKNPPRENPYYVPEEVGKLIHKQALDALMASARLAFHLGKLQNRKVCLPGFTGSPAHAWSHFFEFPPRPGSIGDYKIPDAIEVSLELIAERFSPFLELCGQLGVTFDLECHPSERAMGDLESAGDYIRFMHEAGYGKVVGFNFDASHMTWQGVDPIEFIREYGQFIHCAHLKGVQVPRRFTRGGLLGGHRPMGHKFNGWNFVTAGSLRDANNNEEIFVELNRAGFDGAVCIEWEDNDAQKLHGAEQALANLLPCDLPPSSGRHDETLKA